MVENVISELNTKYGKEAPLTVTRWKVHDNLGMTLDYNQEVSVKVDMSEHIKEMLSGLPKDMKGEAVTLVTTHVFETNEHKKKLSTEEA